MMDENLYRNQLAVNYDKMHRMLRLTQMLLEYPDSQEAISEYGPVRNWEPPEQRAALDAEYGKLP
jgi:hypothetical protein